MNMILETPEQLAAKGAVDSELPPWMVKLIQRQIKLNQKYEKAYALLVERLFADIEEVNEKFGTTFTLEQIAAFESDKDAEDEDDDEDDED